jgi:signal transduction histidine kinase
MVKIRVRLRGNILPISFFESLGRPMHARGLKSSLILNLILVLTGAMLLIDLIMTGASLRGQLNERLVTGETLLSGVLALTGEEPPAQASPYLAEMLLAAKADCLVDLDASGRLLISLGGVCRESDRLRAEGMKALSTGERSAAVNGGLPGLFRPGGTTLIVARPRFEGGAKNGAVAVELSLASLTSSLGRTQRLFLVYFPINLLLFVMFGFFRLYRAVVKPIDRLVATAEEFRDDGGFVFPPVTREGEFNRLSASLNRMLSRINRDRTRLAETVNSLEEANRCLRRAQQEIIRAEKMASVGRLSAGIAHEIGNPIGIIIGYLELLKQPALPAEQKDDFIRRAAGEANRINNIIRQLLDFARATPEQQDRPVAVHRLLREVLELCQSQPLMSGIGFELETGAGEDLVLADSDQLKQVFLNLLLNSADAIAGREATDQPGFIRIRTGNPEPGKLWIEVGDNGPGFGAEQLAYIFDPFYTTKEPGKGTGLGLSICFTIIENLGGEISAGDRDGGGARITLLLPLAGTPGAAGNEGCP